jgi:hypothetical protein
MKQNTIKDEFTNQNLFRAIGITLLLVAIALVAVPRFTDCESQGEGIKTSEGETVPMKCHWSGIAEIGVAIPMYLVGAVMTTTRQRKTLAFLSLLGMIFGALAIAFPVRLIGVCHGIPPMICDTLMKPLLVLLGGIAIAASGLGLALSMAKILSRLSLFLMCAVNRKVLPGENHGWRRKGNALSAL